MTTEVMAAGRDLTGAALDQFLDFAAQHPTVAMLTKAASEMPLPKPGNGNDFQELLWTLGGAGLGLITFSILEKKDFNSNRPARFIDKIIYQAFGFGVGGLFGYCFYHNLNDR